VSARHQPAAGATAGDLARLHLRTGLLRLARVELEELAGQGELDTDGVLDLAEARWRTGDLRGAAEAAGVWLAAPPARAGVARAGARPSERAASRARAGGRSSALAHALVAEGLAVRGRAEDSARHVAAALVALRPRGGPGGPVGKGATDPALATALDALFAGIPPRADGWPPFEPGAGAGPGAPPASAAPAGRVPVPVEAEDPIAAADDRLGAGDDGAAAILLVLALRAAPSRAAEVLDRVDAALAARPSAALFLARAEALRSLGRHDAADMAYAVAEAHARGRGSAHPSPHGVPSEHRADAPGGRPDAAPPVDREGSPR
jgi:hypothetical protein